MSFTTYYKWSGGFDMNYSAVYKVQGTIRYDTVRHEYPILNFTRVERFKLRV